MDVHVKQFLISVHQEHNADDNPQYSKPAGL